MTGATPLAKGFALQRLGLDRDHGHSPFHAASSSERSDPTEAGGYACRPEMIDAPRPLDGLMPGFRAPARRFSKEPQTRAKSATIKPVAAASR